MRLSANRLFTRLTVPLWLLSVASLSHGQSTITPIALPFDLTTPAPDGAYWTELRTPSIDNQGGIAFRGFANERFENGGINSAYRTSSGNYIARAGEQAPGLAPGARFLSIANLQISPGGAAGFLGYIETGPSTWSSGIWAENPNGELRLVAHSGTQVLGAPAGTTWSPFNDAIADNAMITLYDKGSAPFVINARGETAFYAQLDRPGAPQSVEGVWSEGGGAGLRLLAGTGTSVPQYSPGATVVGIPSPWDSVRMNDHGQSVLVATVAAPELGIGGGVGVFIDDPVQGLVIAVKSGQQAPGLRNAQFARFSMPSLNNAGQVTFFAKHVEGASTGEGVWAGLPGDLRLVAQTGDAAPGIDAVFADFNPTLSMPAAARPVINGQGQVAFTARIAGPGVDKSNDSGIWLRDLAGNLQLVAREGDIAIGKEVLGDVTDYSGSLILNNRGQVAFGTYNALWATDVAGNLHNIAQEGDFLPSSNKSIHFGMGRSTGNQDGVGSSFNDRGEFVFFSYNEGYRTGVYLSTAVAIPEPSAAAAMLTGCIMLALQRRRRRTAVR